MTMYNLTCFTNATTILGQSQCAGNDLSGGVLFPGVLLVMWALMFISLKRYETTVAMLTSSFITTIVALFFMFAGLISQVFFAIPLTLLIVSVIIVMFTKD